LPKVQRKRIQDLAVECKVLIDRQQSSEAALRRTDAGLQNIVHALRKLPPHRDTRDLQRTIRRVQKYGDLDEQLVSQRSELERLQEQARVDLAKLPLFSGTLDELETLKIPREDTIERFENELADADERLRRCRESIDSLRLAARQAQTRLDALRLEGEVPTETDLEEARSRRDAGWELVRQAWQEGSADDTTAATFIDEFAAGGDLSGAFLASIEQADRIADRLRREASRVAEKAGLTAQLQRTEADLAQAQQQLASAEQQHQHLLCEWQAQWAAAGIAPLPPREMRAWGPRQQRLAETAADLRQRHGELQQLEERICALREELSDALQALGCPRQPHDVSLSAAL